MKCQLLLNTFYYCTRSLSFLRRIHEILHVSCYNYLSKSLINEGMYTITNFCRWRFDSAPVVCCSYSVVFVFADDFMVKRIMPKHNTKPSPEDIHGWKWRKYISLKTRDLRIRPCAQRQNSEKIINIFTIYFFHSPNWIIYIYEALQLNEGRRI